MGSAPLEQSIMVMAITAADDCTQNVSIPPSSRKSSVVRKLSGSNDEKKLSTTGFSPKCMFVPVTRSVARAKIRNAKPKRKSPI